MYEDGWMLQSTQSFRLRSAPKKYTYMKTLEQYNAASDGYKYKVMFTYKRILIILIKLVSPADSANLCWWRQRVNKMGPIQWDQLRQSKRLFGPNKVQTVVSYTGCGYLRLFVFNFWYDSRKYYCYMLTGFNNT